MKAPVFLATIVVVLSLPCGPWRCNASKFFGIQLYLSFYFGYLFRWRSGADFKVSTIVAVQYKIHAGM